MASSISIISADSDVFFVQQLSSEPSAQRNNSPNNLNSTEFSGIHTKKMPILSPVTSHEPDIVYFDDDSNDLTFPYGFWAQQLIVLPNLNDFNLPPNILTATTVVQQHPTQHDGNYSPQAPESSKPSPNSTLPMNLSTIVDWETPHTTTDNNTIYSDDEPTRAHCNTHLDKIFHSEGEPRRIYLLPSSSPPSLLRKMKRKLEIGMSFPKKRDCHSISAKLENKSFPPTKDIPGPSTKD